MKITKFICFLSILSSTLFSAQKITDGQTVDLDGLSVTFNVTNKESVTAGNKNLDRYKVSATLVNKSNKSFNIRLTNSSQILVDNTLIELDCTNATGAKLTAKKLKLKLKPQNLMVSYWAYDKDGKYNQSNVSVISGYYLDPGDTINQSEIFMVPQGEELNVMARKIN